MSVAREGERTFVKTGLKAGVDPDELYQTCLLASITGKSIEEIRNEHFRIIDVVRAEMQLLHEQFVEDVRQRLGGDEPNLN